MASLTGTLYFGIGTQTNNALGSASVISVTPSTSSQGAGLITAVYKGQTLPDSFIDSGSNFYLFEDSTIPPCTATNLTGFYCPATPVAVNTTIVGETSNVAANFTLNSALALQTAGVAAIPGIGANPAALSLPNAPTSSFDYALDFFFGRNVYTAIEGRTAGGVAGPYYAF